jgi:hypothetical protein
MPTSSERRLADVKVMPRSRGRKGGKVSPNQNTGQLTHSSQTAMELKPCYKVLQRPAAILRVSLRWLWTRKGDFLLWSSVVMTLFAGVFFFFPRVTVESSGPYDPSNPSPITFTISNINIVPLRNVQFAIGLCYITPPERGITLRGGDSGSGTNPLECNGPAGTKIVFMPWTIKWLDTDEKYQVALEDAIKVDLTKQIETANITIAVIYSPWRMFWRNTKEFRFITKKLSDSKVYWIPTPLNR